MRLDLIESPLEDTARCTVRNFDSVVVVMANKRFFDVGVRTGKGSIYWLHSKICITSQI